MVGCGVWIKRFQVSGGFLSGLDIEFQSGLNVLIGGRGTGKTSIIELIRFALEWPAETSERAGSQTNQHALSVLEDGAVTLTVVSESGEEIRIVRSADDRFLTGQSPISIPPLILAQREIESIGMTRVDRLRLVDEFTELPLSGADVTAAEEQIVSLTQSIRSYLVRVDDLGDVQDSIQAIDRQLADLQKASVEASGQSDEAEKIRGVLSELGQQQQQQEQQLRLLDRTIEEGRQLAQTLRDAFDSAKDIRSLVRRQSSVMPEKFGDGFEVEVAKVDSAREGLSRLFDDLEGQREKVSIRVSEVKEHSRERRQRLEELQEGLGAIAKRSNELQSARAEAQSTLDDVVALQDKIERLQGARSKLLDELEVFSSRLLSARIEAAEFIESRVGRSIRVGVEGSAILEPYEAAVERALSGSRIRRDVVSRIVSSVAPRELLEVIEQRDYTALAQYADIGLDRSTRVIEALLQSDGFARIAVTRPGDDVSLSLLDGDDYKAFYELSMGQRCSVVLPVLLQHRAKTLILDQPEDHLDNSFVTQTVVPALRSRSSTAQTIVATHNANLAVLGEPDLVVSMDSDGFRGFCSAIGSLDGEAVSEAIVATLEGGQEAFRARTRIYAKRFNS